MRQIAEKEKDYPEPNMFGTTPAHGFFIRHVRGLEMDRVKIEHAKRRCAAGIRSRMTFRVLTSRA